MWNLVMGALMSSEDEGENHTTQGEGEFQEEGENPALKGDGRNQTNISTTNQGTDEFGVSKGVLDANDDLQVAGSAARNINQAGGPSQVHSAELRKREEGDGMEKPVLVKTPSEIFKVTSVVLPETGVALDKIPPISDKVDLRPVHPTSTLVKEKAKIYPKGTLPPAVKKSKEAKFVPCEPYKGAVSPMSANNPPGRKCSRKSPAKTLSAPNLMLNKSLSPRRQDSNVTADDETDALFMLNTSSSRAAAAADSKDANRQNSINEDSVEEDGDEEMNPMLKENYRAMLEAKERELNRLRSGLEDAEKQLRIQSQVNGELKSLLVASVGEDIEARLDFLTQDKARLAADVVQYNNKISRDWEEKEALHVESDIWRSKFLASTVILEELTRTKQALESRNHQLEHAARRILMERKEMGTKLHHVDVMLRSVLVSHGVVDTDQVNTDETAAADMMKLTADIESSTNKICDKLAGDKGLRYTSATEPEHRLTQAERDLEQLLVNSQRHDESDLPDQASCRLTRGARTLLMKMGDKAQSPGKSAFNSCSHCNGTVETV